MQRYAIQKLIEWKYDSKRKPLIIRGARQVGKTWLMKVFGKTEYKKTIYINFELENLMCDLFSLDFDTKRIIEGLELAYSKIDAKNTLIILDEIQECPKAITALKYFYENYPEYNIVAAGSLLGVAIHENISFPVGKVDFLDLYPLSFLEFLEAIGENNFVKLLKTPTSPNLKIFKEKYIDWLKKYYYIGGMPEAVSTFIETNDFQKVRKVQENILDAYTRDFSKHISSTGKLKIDLLWESIPNQITQESKKFVYKKIKSGARADEFEEALSWLINCGLVYKINRITKPAMPLKAYEDTKAFKLFILDVGLLSALSKLPARTLIEGDKVFTEFNGALAEQYVLQQLKTLEDIEIAYWISKSGNAELNFILQTDGYVIPVEVKANTNLQAKSLKVYREKFEPEISMRTSLADFEINNGLYNIPLFMVGKFDEILKDGR
ncbi:MAG: ATP-binding protein [Bacteroides sp.]|nr:ATP-binding protein [Bacteroides sp.]